MRRDATRCVELIHSFIRSLVQSLRITVHPLSSLCRSVRSFVLCIPHRCTATALHTHRTGSRRRAPHRTPHFALRTAVASHPPLVLPSLFDRITLLPRAAAQPLLRIRCLWHRTASRGVSCIDRALNSRPVIRFFHRTCDAARWSKLHAMNKRMDDNQACVMINHVYVVCGG